MPTVLAVIGHPRNEGSCITLLDVVEETLRAAGVDVDRVHLADFAIQACGANHVCAEGNGCVIRDGMWSMYPKIAACRGLLVATPVFYHGLPSGLKAFVDRCQPFWEDRFRRKQNLLPVRKGMVILTAGSKRRPGFESVHDCLGSFFESVAVRPEVVMEVGGLDHSPPIAEQPECLERARHLGKRYAKLVLDDLKPGRIVHPWWQS